MPSTHMAVQPPTAAAAPRAAGAGVSAEPSPHGARPVHWPARPALVAAQPLIPAPASERPAAWPTPPRGGLQVKRRRSGWRPGVNCAGYLDRGHSASAQAQALIANVYHNVQRLGVATRSRIEKELGPTRPRHSGRSHQDSRATCAGRLLGVPPSTVSNTISNLRRRGVQPGRARGRRPAIAPNDGAAKAVLTREALALAVAGQPKTDFRRTTGVR